MANKHAACQKFEYVDNYALSILTCFCPGFSMSSIQVRPATLRDAKAIAQIHTASALEAYRGLVPDDQLKAMSSVEKRQAYWREAIEYCEPQVQVAIDGARPPARSGPSMLPLPTGIKVLASPCGTPPVMVCWKKVAPM